MFPRGLTYLVIGAALFAIAGLAVTIRGAFKFGSRRRFATPAGSEWQGIRYALSAGMTPWAKESARHHVPTYFAGVIYHLGIAASFTVLAATMFSAEFSPGANIVLLSLTLAGAAAGMGLLAKRAVVVSLRAISTPDDFISNALATLFLLLAAATISTQRFAIVFLVVAAALLIYIPLGKIRHCFLFFWSRITFGRFFGQRGILPHSALDVKEAHGR